MAGEPLDVNTLYQMLLDGGYEFEAKSETNAKNSIRVTLSKNSTVFLKLSNGKYGLLNWYPNAKTRKKKGGEGAQESENQDNEIDGQSVMQKEFGLEPEIAEKEVEA